MQDLGLQDVPKPDPPKKASRVLVASCAAVLTVYAAGYIRTQNAADRLASQISKRRATVSTPQQAHLSIRDSAAFRGSGRDGREEHGDHRKPWPPKPPPEATSKEVPDPVSEPELKRPLGIAALEKAEIPICLTLELRDKLCGSQRSRQSPLTPAQAGVPVPAPAPETAAAPAPEAAAAPAQVWKNGSYTGWGYSRHGNIEATVVIEGGRIASAIISQCRTRYSCSVIDRLPPQVARRQSPDVDYVSGATQSADAFYGAVVEALNKAKLK
jgi:uncharacterized protein with FMN-binding domain